MSKTRLAPSHRPATTLTLALLLPWLGGCAATLKTIRHGELELRTEVSRSVFLEPGTHAPTVYLELRNSSGHEIAIQGQVAALLGQAGYAMVERPDDASYLLQGNVLQVTTRMLDDGETIQDAMLTAAVGGAVAGAVTGSVLDAEGIADEVMLLAGLASFVVDARTRRPAYTMLTDLRLTEKLGGPDGEPRRNVHDVRITSGATKVNLKLEEALPGMTAGLARAIAGILPPAARPKLVSAAG